MSEQKKTEKVVEPKKMFFGPNCSVVLKRSLTANEEPTVAEEFCDNVQPIAEDLNASAVPQTKEIPSPATQTTTVPSNSSPSPVNSVTLSMTSTVRRGRRGWRDHFESFVDGLLSILQRVYNKFNRPSTASPTTTPQTNIR